jgi:hypothetical protein
MLISPSFKTNYEYSKDLYLFYSCKVYLANQPTILDLIFKIKFSSHYDILDNIKPNLNIIKDRIFVAHNDNLKEMYKINNWIEYPLLPHNINYSDFLNEIREKEDMISLDLSKTYYTTLENYSAGKYHTFKLDIKHIFSFKIEDYLQKDIVINNIEKMIQISNISSGTRLPLFTSEFVADYVHKLDDLIFNPILDFNNFISIKNYKSIIPSLNDPLLINKREFKSNWGYCNFLNTPINTFSNYVNQILSRKIENKITKVITPEILKEIPKNNNSITLKKEEKNINNNIVTILKKRKIEEIEVKEDEKTKRKIDLLIDQFLDNGIRLKKFKVKK